MIDCITFQSIDHNHSPAETRWVAVQWMNANPDHKIINVTTAVYGSTYEVGVWHINPNLKEENHG